MIRLNDVSITKCDLYYFLDDVSDLLCKTSGYLVFLQDNKKMRTFKTLNEALAYGLELCKIQFVKVKRVCNEDDLPF